jgi:hypothetical protein
MCVLCSRNVKRYLDVCENNVCKLQEVLLNSFQTCPVCRTHWKTEKCITCSHITWCQRIVCWFWSIFLSVWMLMPIIFICHLPLPPPLNFAPIFSSFFFFSFFFYYGATSRGGPWTPLQYVSKLLDPLLHLSTFFQLVFSIALLSV